MTSYATCFARRSIRRPLAYTIEKLVSLLNWRAESGAITLDELMTVATKTLKESGVSPARYDQAVKLANTMNNNSIYVHGYDKVRSHIYGQR